MVFTHPLFVFLRILEEDLRVGAVLREQNALPTTRLLGVLFAAKDAIDNGGAGRAAKGGNPLLCARILKGFSDFAESLFSCRFSSKSVKTPFHTPLFAYFYPSPSSIYEHMII